MCAAVKRIGFVSTRFAGTDGVSLETFKWIQVLERNRYECFAFAGEMETPPEHSFLEPLAHFSHPEILAIHPGGNRRLQRCAGFDRLSYDGENVFNGIADHIALGV